jgi:hypothetical protein
MAPGAPAGSELNPLRLENKPLREKNAPPRRLTTCIPKLLARISELEKKPDEALRAQRRQAAPFSNGPPNGMSVFSWISRHGDD